MTFILFNRLVDTFEDLIETVTEDLETDDYWRDCNGNLPIISDKDDLHDLVEQYIDEDDYNEFRALLYDESNDFNGIEIDDSDPWDEAKRYYYSTRLVNRYD